MKRIPAFLLGVVVGALGLFMALNYHFVRANDGMHMIRKTSSSLSGTYADVRGYTPTDWANHPDLAAAIMASGEQELIEDVAGEALFRGLDNVLGQ